MLTAFWMLFWGIWLFTIGTGTDQMLTRKTENVCLLLVLASIVSLVKAGAIILLLLGARLVIVSAAG